MNEVWKPVETYEGSYEVSNLGNVRSLPRTFNWGINLISKTIEGKILKLHLHKAGKRNGYYQIRFGNKKRFYVHRLVAQAFIENIHNYPCINHIDGDGTNNKVENLEWCSYSQNRLHSARVLGAKSSCSKEVFDLKTGIYYSTQTQAFLSRSQPVKFSQFACMLSGKWPNKTDFIRI